MFVLLWLEGSIQMRPHCRLKIAYCFCLRMWIELCGLMWIKLLQSAHLCWTWRTRHWRGLGNDLGCWPSTKLPAAAIMLIVGLNSEDVNGQTTDQTMRRYVMCCVLDSTAVTRWHPVADWLSIRAFQAVSNDRPSDNYCTMSSVCAVEQGTHDTCLHAQYRLIAGHSDNRKVPIPQSISRNRY